MQSARPEAIDEPSQAACPVCGGGLTRANPDWWFVCAACGMQVSNLDPAFDDRPMAEMFDWGQRESAFNDFRVANAERLLARLRALMPPPARLLDVGCAEGWFIAAAGGAGYRAEGLEPDARMAARASTSLAIRTGFFPEALDDGEEFDIITFNDVFEHLPDVGAAMAACRRHLRSGGMLAINLPDARGALYRLSGLLARIGVTGPFERMWQAGYPSPHLTYFTPATLGRLAEREGLVERACFALPAVQARGLWARIRCDRTRPWIYSAAGWCAVMGALPLLALAPSDISVQIFEKPASPQPMPGDGRS